MTRPVTLLSVPLALGFVLSACGDAAPSAGPAATTSTASTRAVEHARGTTEVPADPQRVVVLEPVQLDTAVALGVTPVGAAVASAAIGVPAYLDLDADEVVQVGTVPEPSVEAVAALRPDLVLGTESRHSALYEQLSRIAPTVFMASQADAWQDNVGLVGRALGREDEARELLADHDARCAEVATEHSLEGVSANLLRPRDEATTSLYGPTSFAGSVLECAGLTIPDRDWEGSISVDLSPERVPEAAADHVFVTTSDVDDPATLPTLVREAGPEFGLVHPVDQSTWITGVGPLGGRAVLDDLDAVLDASS